MPLTDWGWQITPEELSAWLVEDTGHWLVVDKPPFVVCHPSKHGPWSSLIGACREYCGLERLHMPFRLDRETSGVVVLAKDAETGSRMQRAVERRHVHKTYLAILTGELREVADVDAPLGPHPGSKVVMRRAVVAEGQPARTRFTPLAAGGGYTLARVETATGRLHQVRVHAAHLGHALAGDKIYGPDESLFLEFVEKGFSERLAACLPLRRHALHCAEVVFDPSPWWSEGLRFCAPLAADLAEFCRDVMRIDFTTGATL